MSTKISEKEKLLLGRIGVLNQEIERLNNIINELKLCNSDYYNQINTLSSKLSLINSYINENKNCVPKHISDYINKVLFDNKIKLGSDKE